MKRAHALDVAKIAALAREVNADLSKVYAWAGVQHSIPTQEQAAKMLHALEAKKASLSPSS